MLSDISNIINLSTLRISGTTIAKPQLSAMGSNLEAVTAMLDQLSVDELSVLIQRVQEVIKVKRAVT